MLLNITHRTQYRYDKPVPYALQRLRLVPQSGETQTVRAWSLAIEGAEEEVRFSDQFENETWLVSVSGGADAIAIEASGTVETFDKAGMTGPHRGFVPLWLYLHQTRLTEPGEGVASLAGAIGAGNDVERLHRLLGAVGEAVAYRPGSSDTTTTAEEALAAGSGVCQDHTHVFAAAARRLGFPARYVSGYLMMDSGPEQAASHAWAEAHVEGIGWLAFDAANGISPDERYVRLAVGRDYRDAMPVSGIRLGDGREHLEVHLTVEQ